MSNCSFEAVDNWAGSLQMLIYIAILPLGLLLNIVSLMVCSSYLQKWKVSRIYLINLILMDMLLRPLMLFKMNQWTANKRLFCSFLESVYFVSIYGSIYTIMCMTAHRYIHIVHTVWARERHSQRDAILTCAVIWVLVLGAATPVYRFHSHDESAFYCFHGFSKEAWSPALIACLEVLGFLVPALVLVTCSVQIIRTMHRLQRLSTKIRRGIRFIYGSLCFFLVSFTPCHVGIFLQFLVRNDIITDCDLKNNISLFVQVAMSLTNLSYLQAFCYYLLIKKILAILAIRTTGQTLRQSFNLPDPPLEMQVRDIVSNLRKL